MICLGPKLSFVEIFVLNTWKSVGFQLISVTTEQVTMNATAYLMVCQYFHSSNFRDDAINVTVLLLVWL